MNRIVTKEDYLQSFKDLHHVVYYNGKRVEDVTNILPFGPTSIQPPLLMN